MKRTTGFVLAGAVASSFLLMACSEQSETGIEKTVVAAEVAETEAGQPAMAEPLSFPDPGPEVAGEVELFVRDWLEERAGEGSVYSIPPRAGHEVAGTLAEFHTVHQKNADTYAICVDFADGENTYDVDFFVARTPNGLAVDDHYLHKVNGAAIE